MNKRLRIAKKDRSDSVYEMIKSDDPEKREIERLAIEQLNRIG